MLTTLLAHVLAVQPQLQSGFDPISAAVLQPIFPGRYTKLVYNRVPKTGSTTMIKLAEQLAKKNNFKLVVDDEYFPNASRLAEIISSLPERTMYINHCNLWMDAPESVGFINMVRHPFEHDESWFYYGVDSDARPQELAKKELSKRKEKGPCGCYKLEYDKCVHIRHINNCSVMFSGAHFRQFCNAAEKWGHDQSNKVSMHTAQSDTKFWCDATQSLLTKYAFVGLTEQYVRSVATLELLLPDWFTGASELLASTPPAKQTHMKNNVTGTVHALPAPNPRPTASPPLAPPSHPPPPRDHTRTLTSSCLTRSTRWAAFPERPRPSYWQVCNPPWHTCSLPST